MSYTFGNRAASSDVYSPFDSIEDGHFDIPISQAGKVWLHAHKGLTRVGNDTCRSGTRKEMRSGDIIDAGGIKFRCMTVHKEEETGGPPQTRFIMHGSGDHSAVAEASEEGITIHETVLPKDIYLDADPAKMRVEHFLWQCLEDETEDKADIAAVLESNLAEKAVAMEPNVSIAFLTQTKSGSSILVLLSNDSIDSLRDIGRVSCPSPLAHVRIMLRYSRRSYQCGGADISLDFPGIQLAHFAIQVGDKDGDNLWIHTHNGAIFVDGNVMRIRQTMSMTNGLVIEVCGVEFRCEVFRRGEEARRKGLGKRESGISRGNHEWYGDWG